MNEYDIQKHPSQGRFSHGSKNPGFLLLALAVELIKFRLGRVLHKYTYSTGTLYTIDDAQQIENEL